MKTAEYLAAVKAKRNITSDYKLAKALGLQQSLVTKYQKGTTVPGPLVAFKIAEILGDQPAAVIADFELERAEKTEKADDAEEWRGFVKKLGGAAASILLVMGLGGFSNADARLVNQANNQSIYTSYQL
jgi:transcriptional regulator with XRE-family HTH domain